MSEPIALIPFIPSGANFARSRDLFLELGCEVLWSQEGYVGFRWGGAKFILQNYNVPAFAENLMLKMEVADLEAWWSAIAAKSLPERFAGFRLNPPKDFPWGREVHFIDLAGVLWQVRAA